MARRILIIDDDSDILDVTELSLAMFGGYEVTKAASGREGIAEAQRIAPDAILLDARMPELSGPETLRELRATPETATIPVVFLTASVQLRDRQELEDLGAAGVIIKPFDPTTLGTELSAMLGW